MKKTRCSTLLSLIILPVILILVIAISKPVAAVANCNGVETSVEFNCTDTAGAGGINSIILWVINFLAVGVGIAVVGGIVWGGVIYAMSDGDAGKAKEGREIIVNAIIGLFLFLFLWAGANFLVPGGVFK